MGRVLRSILEGSSHNTSGILKPKQYPCKPESVLFSDIRNMRRPWPQKAHWALKKQDSLPSQEFEENIVGIQFHLAPYVCGDGIFDVLGSIPDSAMKCFSSGLVRVILELPFSPSFHSMVVFSFLQAFCSYHDIFSRSCWNKTQVFLSVEENSPNKTC